MKWDIDDIAKILGGGGVLTTIATIVASMMGWVRFGKRDSAEVEKLKSETAINKAIVSEKRTSDEVKITNTLLDLNIHLSTRLEQANVMIDRQNEEKGRLYNIINKMRADFERDVLKLKNDYNKRINDLEKEFNEDREKSRLEIKRLIALIDGKN